MYSPDWLQMEAKKHQEKARAGTQGTWGIIPLSKWLDTGVKSHL